MYIYTNGACGTRLTSTGLSLIDVCVHVCVLMSTSLCGCPNNDVVVVQPRTWNAPYLGSVAIFTT